MFWVFIGSIIGFAVGALVIILTVYLPGQKTADEQQKNLVQWSELLRVEQQRISDQKQISESQIVKWTSMISEQNARFNQIEQRLHEQEIELADPGIAIIVIVGLVALVSMAFLAFMFRDTNKEAATTLQNLSAMSPEMIVSAVREWRIDERTSRRTISASRPAHPLNGPHR
jgi:flagellar basal body-associated protein FliL